MKKKYSIYILLLSIIIALVTWQLISLNKENNRLRNLISMQATKKGQSDSYIVGPVKNRILKGYSSLKKCYQSYTNNNPKIRQGKIKIDWQIRLNGSVENPEIISSNFHSKEFENCLLSKIIKWKFPEPIIKKYVSHLFRFNDKKKKAIVK